MRLVFMGTPDFSVPTLRALIQSTDHDLCAVYTATPKPAKRGMQVQKSPVHLLAEAHGYEVRTPLSLKSTDAHEAFRELRADIAIVIAYGLLLPQPILDAYPHGCINVHPSDLPRWRGAAPIQRTIMAGDRHTALCMMQMDAGLDTGAVLTRTAYDVPCTMTAGMLHDHMAEAAAHAVLHCLHGINNQSLSATPQTEEGVTYATKIRKEEAWVNLQRSASDVQAHIHGLSPSPAAYVIVHNERVRLLAVEVVHDSSDAIIGTIIDTHFTIKTGCDAIRPRIIQREGKKPMETEACLRGWHIPIGTMVGYATL